MHRSPSRPPRGGHPATDLQRTTVGLVLFTLVMTVVVASLLYPLLGVAAVALTTAVAVARVVRPRLRRLVQTVRAPTDGTETEPRPGSQAD